jgi:predicted PurR-regulated permease PerM
MASGTWRERRESIALTVLVVIAFILVAAALRATYAVTMPLVLAFFVAVLVRPIQGAIARRLPRWLYWVSVLVTMLVLLLVLGAVGWVILLGIRMVAANSMQYVETAQAQWQRMVGWAQTRGVPVEGDVLGGMWDYALTWLGAGISSIWSVLAMVVLVFFFVLLMLLEVRDWKAKSHEALPTPQAFRLIDVTGAIGEKLRWFLLVRTSTGLTSGSIAGLILWLLDVDCAWFWALEIWLLNYIPYIGSIIGYTLPTLLALVQHGVGTAALALGLMGGSDQIIGNIIDPLLQGRTLRISPVMLLVSITFWGWVWGAIGALLAAPMLITITTICQHVPALEPVAVLLAQEAGDGEAKAVAAQDE